MAHDRRRLQRRLVVSVSHCGSGLFVHAGDEFGFLIVAIYGDRFMQTEKARAWIGEYIFKVERPHHINHEIRAETLRVT